jgi:hypothetical protein
MTVDNDDGASQENMRHMATVALTFLAEEEKERPGLQRRVRITTCLNDFCGDSKSPDVDVSSKT